MTLSQFTLGGLDLHLTIIDNTLVFLKYCCITHFDLVVNDVVASAHARDDGRAPLLLAHAEYLEQHSRVQRGEVLGHGHVLPDAAYRVRHQLVLARNLKSIWR